MGKGSKRRPRLVSREEEDLRWDYAQGKIGPRTFDKRLKEIRDGLDSRAGRTGR